MEMEAKPKAEESEGEELLFDPKEEEKLLEELEAGEFDEKEGTPQEEQAEEEKKPAEEEAGAEEPTYEVVVDGEKRSVTLEELRNGYQFQSHNTRKAQELARKEQELDLMKRELEENWMGYDVKPKPLIPGVERQSKPEPGGEEPQFASPTEKLLWEKTQELERELGSFRNEQSASRREQMAEKAKKITWDAINDFHKEHKEMTKEDVGEVIKRANELGMRPSAAGFEAVWRSMLDPEQVANDAVKQYLAKKKKQGEDTNLHSGRGSETVEPKPDVANMSDEEWEKAMLEDAKKHKIV